MRKKLRMAFELITSQSTKPLRLAVGVGFTISAIALIALIVFIIYKLISPDVAVGWASLICAVFLVGGLSIAFAGISGLYIGNIFEEVKNRPLYIVGKVLNGSID